MSEARRQVTLSNTDRATKVGRQLIDLLVELSDDGNVSRDEMSRLRLWLEIDHGVNFPCLAFLHETIEHISSDGEVTEDELDRLALAIERVLPKDIRLAAIAKRKQVREERRADREKKRQSLAAQRAESRKARNAERMRARILHQSEFPVRGSFRSEERREACERLQEDDSVKFEREPDNAHDANAILVLAEDDSELGYVPREEAAAMARLLDAGAEVDARVRLLWKTPDGQVVPILRVRIRRGDADSSIPAVSAISRRAGKGTSTSARKPSQALAARR
jgi:hypothetical protein